MHLLIRYDPNAAGTKRIAIYDRFLIVMDDGSEIDISQICRSARPQIASGQVSSCDVEFLNYRLEPGASAPKQDKV